MNNAFPKITIVTVCKNTVDTIERSINSILDQKYPNLEYIVIDGTSTDGTVDILNKYKDSFTKFMSAPPKGIYEAMNRGISEATGEWILFMNAQDVFYTDTTLQTIAKELNDTIDVAYGGYVFNHVYGVSEYRPPVQVTELWKGMNICHQSILTRTKLLKEYPYNLSYKIVADYDAILHQLYQQHAQFHAIQAPVAILSGGGLSDKKRMASLKEQILVAEKYDTSAIHKIWRRCNLMYRGFRVFIRDLLPRTIVRNYLKRTRKNQVT